MREEEGGRDRALERRVGEKGDAINRTQSRPSPLRRYLSQNRRRLYRKRSQYCVEEKERNPDRTFRDRPPLLSLSRSRLSGHLLRRRRPSHTPASSGTFLRRGHLRLRASSSSRHLLGWFRRWCWFRIEVGVGF